MAKYEDKVEEAVAETKGVAEQFIQTLGLADIVLGGLALYWVRLWFGSGIAVHFTSTGYPWVDIALLACAAAFCGKVLSLLADVVAAGVEGFIQKVDLLKAGSTLKASIREYERLKGGTLNTEQWEQVDLALTYTTRANPHLRSILEQNRTTTTLAYSATLLMILFLAYFYKVGVPWLLILVMLICIVAFLLLAFVKQLDYLLTLRNNLTTLLLTDPTPASQLTAGKP